MVNFIKSCMSFCCNELESNNKEKIIKSENKWNWNNKWMFHH